jgi:hypothetical protein
MKILGIDIGYHNLALVLAECSKTDIIEIIDCKKISLGDYKYIKSNDIVDLVPLMIDDHKFFFQEAEQIVIERQPPGGFTNVECLINYITRHKSLLVSPNAMHAYFGLGHLSYENRKEYTEKIAYPYLKDNYYYNKLDRKHDIADAICLILFQNNKNTMEFKRNELVERSVFSEFLYTKSTQSPLSEQPQKEKYSFN